MINKQGGKATKNVMPYYISQTINNLKEVIRTKLEEFRKGRIMSDNRNDMTTYLDFMACDVPKFDGALDPVASTRWLVAVEGAFILVNCKEKNKVNFTSNFLRDSAKMWWEGKVCEKEEFQNLIGINDETVNKMWKKFNDLIRYCPEYHGNEKLKVERFQRMLDDLLRHKSNECPNPKEIEAKPLKSVKEEKMEKAGIPNPMARVYMMATEKEKVKPDVVTCTILVNSKPARVLYDLGASVSFVSYEFSKNLSIPPNKLPLPLEVEIAGDKVVVVSNVYREVEIEIDDNVFRIDLIPIMSGKSGLERRIHVFTVLDTAYWGFLGVGTTFDIFQNIILITYLEYDVLSPLDTTY
ncbi:zinc finger, CCHC-type, retrotransposon gag domain protein [Tanacetum coccineum]